MGEMEQWGKQKKKNNEKWWWFFKKKKKLLYFLFLLFIYFLKVFVKGDILFEIRINRSNTFHHSDMWQFRQNLSDKAWSQYLPISSQNKYNNFCQYLYPAKYIMASGLPTTALYHKSIGLLRPTHCQYIVISHVISLVTKQRV